MNEITKPSQQARNEKNSAIKMCVWVVASMDKINDFLQKFQTEQPLQSLGLRIEDNISNNVDFIY